MKDSGHGLLWLNSTTSGLDIQVACHGTIQYSAARGRGGNRGEHDFLVYFDFLMFIYTSICARKLGLSPALAAHTASAAPGRAQTLQGARVLHARRSCCGHACSLICTHALLHLHLSVEIHTVSFKTVTCSLT